MAIKLPFPTPLPSSSRRFSTGPASPPATPWLSSWAAHLAAGLLNIRWNRPSREGERPGACAGDRQSRPTNLRKELTRCVMPYCESKARYCLLPGPRRRSRAGSARRRRKPRPPYVIRRRASKGRNCRCRVLQDPHSWVPWPAEGPRSGAEGAAQRSGKSHRRLLNKGHRERACSSLCERGGSPDPSFDCGQGDWGTKTLRQGLGIYQYSPEDVSEEGHSCCRAQQVLVTSDYPDQIRFDADGQRGCPRPTAVLTVTACGVTTWLQESLAREVQG